MIDWDRWGGEPPDRYQIAMLVILLVAVVGLLALLGGFVDAPGSEPRPTTDGCENALSPAEPAENQSKTPVAPMIENASLRCGADPRGGESKQTTNSLVGVRLE
jgi:hypothetical protein